MSLKSKFKLVIDSRDRVNSTMDQSRYDISLNQDILNVSSIRLGQYSIPFNTSNSEKYIIMNINNLKNNIQSNN